MSMSDWNRIHVRLPPDLDRDMREFAVEHGRSLNGEIVWALREYRKREKAEKDRQKK